MALCGGVAVAEAGLVGVMDEVGVMLGMGLLLGVLLAVGEKYGATVLLGLTTGVSSPGRGVFVAVAAYVALAVNVGHGGTPGKTQDLVGVGPSVGGGGSDGAGASVGAGGSVGSFNELPCASACWVGLRGAIARKRTAARLKISPSVSLGLVAVRRLCMAFPFCLLYDHIAEMHP